MKSFYVAVEFTDAKGFHPVGSVVNLPYTTDLEIADAQSMVRYGVVTEQAPEATVRPNNENVIQVVQPGPMVLPPANDENPQPAEPEVEVHDHEVGEEEPAAEEPVQEETPAEETPAEEPSEEPNPEADNDNPKSRSRRKR